MTYNKVKNISLLGIFFMCLSIDCFAQRELEFFEPDFDSSYCLQRYVYHNPIALLSSSGVIYRIHFLFHYNQFFSKSAHNRHISCVEKIITHTVYKGIDSTIYNYYYDYDGFLVKVDGLACNSYDSTRYSQVISCQYSNEHKCITVHNTYNGQLNKLFFNDKHLLDSISYNKPMDWSQVYHSRFLFDSLNRIKSFLQYDSCNKLAYTQTISYPRADTDYYYPYNIDDSDAIGFVFAKDFFKGYSVYIDSMSKDGPDGDFYSLVLTHPLSLYLLLTDINNKNSNNDIISGSIQEFYQWDYNHELKSYIRKEISSIPYLRETSSMEYGLKYLRNKNTVEVIESNSLEKDATPIKHVYPLKNGLLEHIEIDGRNYFYNYKYY